MRHSEMECERLLAVTRNNFEAECSDMDKVLALFPDLHRSEGGRLPVARLVNAICDLSARCKMAEALVNSNVESCVYCGEVYPKPVSYHHTLDECRATEATAIKDVVESLEMIHRTEGRRMGMVTEALMRSCIQKLRAVAFSSDIGEKE